MNQNDFKIIRYYLCKIKNISGKLAADITEIDLSRLEAYSNIISATLDIIESETTEV